MGLINNYHVSEQLTQATPVKEEVAFSYTSSNANTIKTHKNGGYNCFHCIDPNIWANECPKLSEKEKAELIATKENGGRIHKQVSEVAEDKNTQRTEYLCC